MTNVANDVVQQDIDELTPGDHAQMSNVLTVSDRTVLFEFVYSLNIERVWLPEDFERAKRAIAALADVDTVKELIDKSKAMDTYAREIKDGEQMRANLRKVLIRAWKRLGELYLGERTSPVGGRPKTAAGAGVLVSHSARGVGRKLGHSRHQVDKAINIANVPDTELDEAIAAGESETAIAKRGRRKRPPNSHSNECRSADRLVRLLQHTREEVAAIDIASVVEIMKDQEWAEILVGIREAADWWNWVRAQAEHRSHGESLSEYPKHRMLALVSQPVAAAR